MVVYGIEDTMKALEAGVIDVLICYEGIDWKRVKIRNKETLKENVFHVKPEEEAKDSNYKENE